MLTHPSRLPQSLPAGLEEAFRLIGEKTAGIAFGTVTLVIHEGKLTQMEITEKRRFGP